MHKSVYLDFNATTPLDSRVLTAMKPYLENSFGNPASQLHQKGWEAKAAAEIAREKVAKLLGAQPQEIVFTSSATESNNWALKGLVDFLSEENPGKIPHILTSNVEHASVREPLLYLHKKGLAEVDFLPVDAEGFLSLEKLEKARKPTTRILSLIWIQNEIGTIQNMKAVAAWAQDHNIYLHTDATQAVGKIHVNVQDVPVSLLSFSGHKLYGPKGVGVLFVRHLNPKVILRPLLHGGGQESLGRSGTLNVPGIVGIGEACAIAASEMSQDYDRVRKWTSGLWSKLSEEFPVIKLNGPSIHQRTPFNLSLTLPGIQGFELMPKLSDLCVSGGSACSSGNLQGSPVLLAIGHNADDPSVTLRLSAGRMNSEEDFHQAFSSLSKALKSLHFDKSAKGSHSTSAVLK